MTLAILKALYSQKPLNIYKTLDYVAYSIRYMDNPTEKIFFEFESVVHEISAFNDTNKPPI